MGDLMDLASRIEAAEAPSRDLFRSAYAACHSGRLFDAPATPGFQATHAKWNSFAILIEAGAFLDAAMSLVPSGVGDELLSIMLKRSYRNDASVLLLDSLTGHQWHGDAATPALALTAACLRARALASTGDPRND